jgi:hypothetical protein
VTLILSQPLNNSGLHPHSSPLVEDDRRTGTIGAIWGKRRRGKRATTRRELRDYEQFSQTRCNLRRANENPMFRKVPDQKPGTLRSQDWFDNADKHGLTIEERTADGS